MTIKENVLEIKEKIDICAKASGRSGRDILLVAAAKTNPASLVREAIAAGVDAIGENRIQEMEEKLAQGAYEGASLHFIGHLQRNKAARAVGVCDLIESVGSIPLLELISKRAQSINRPQDVLLEVNIAMETSKSGFSPERLHLALESASLLDGVRVRGLMAIPPISVKAGASRAYFAGMYKLFVDIAEKKYDNVSMDFLSMGMSGDYLDAIAEGANIVRVGSAVFGKRTY